MFLDAAETPWHVNGDTAACLAGQMGGEHEQERTEGVHGSRRACVQMAMGWWLALVIVGDAVLAGGGGRYKSGRGGLAAVVGGIS